MANVDFNESNSVNQENLTVFGGREKVETITASRTLRYEDSGKTFLVGTDALVITLPATKAGIVYKFFNSGADGNNIITISPNASDGMHGKITLGAGDVTLSGTDNKDLINTKATATTADSVEIVGDGNVGWFVRSSTGIWASEA